MKEPLSCPMCGANKLLYLPDRTLKCEYCETTFLINDDEFPDAIVKAKFGTEDFFSDALRYLSEYVTAPSDIFESEFEEVKIQFRSFRSAHYDVNLVYQKEHLDLDSKEYIPYYLLRYLYDGKAYYLGAYGIGITKSFGTPPNVMERINKAIKKRIGNDILGIISLIIGFVLLICGISFLSVMSILFFAVGITLSVLYYKKFKSEQKKELIKNNDERMANYLKFISSINNNN